MKPDIIFCGLGGIAYAIWAACVFSKWRGVKYWVAVAGGFAAGFAAMYFSMYIPH